MNCSKLHLQNILNIFISYLQAMVTFGIFFLLAAVLAKASTATDLDQPWVRNAELETMDQPRIPIVDFQTETGTNLCELLRMIWHGAPCHRYT